MKVGIELRFGANNLLGEDMANIEDKIQLGIFKYCHPLEVAFFCLQRFG